MNISYKWLKEYVDFDLSPEALAELLTSIGLETGSVERVESIKGGLAGIVIGKVLTCDIHPDSDHLHITTVDLDGSGTPTQIVCGAPNVAAGQVVVVATVGTTLYTPEGEAFKIKKSKIRGVESFGMICAEDEIGVGTSHNGIIVLPEAAEAMVGKPAAVMNKEDKVKAIQFLSQNGAFLITKSGDKVAKYFGISKYTLYSYIDMNKQEGT